jgi:acyl-CoA synthetase (AMP-forming)/AMP-acid ligase II/acyl carrier protein
MPMTMNFDCIAELLRVAAEREPEGTALLAPGRAELSYRALWEHVQVVAGQLASRGLGPEDRVAIVHDNGPEAASAFLGVAVCAVSAPLNPAYGVEEFAFYLADLRVKSVIVAANSSSPVVKAATDLGIPLLPIAVEPNAKAGQFRFVETREAASPRFSKASDTAMLLHTSGTTSRPKIVPLSHANLCASARHIRETLALQPHDRCLNVMPLFHIHGLIAALLASLSAGASVACTPGFSGNDFFAWLEDCKATWYTAVPTMHQAIVAKSSEQRERIARIKLRFIRSSSAALPPSVLANLEEIFHTPVVEAYGMTEAAHQMASNPLPPRTRKPGSVGVAAGPDVAIMGPDGELLPSGGVGEIVIRGPNVTAGYENNPDANRDGFRNGWFRTSDQGVLDAEGYLTITGRLKELINRGGEKIAPREVDEALLAHPAVAQAVAFAAPHTTLGEDVAAAVILRPGTSASEAELRAFVANRLAHFKVPARVLIVDQIPKGPTGKVQRIGLAKALGVTAAPATAKARGAYIAPRTEFETIVARIWEDVLRVERVGIDEPFLTLGGDSMAASRVIVRLRDQLGIDLPLAALFVTPTVAEVAAAVERLVAESPEMAEVDALSEDEVRRLLSDENTPT